MDVKDRKIQSNVNEWICARGGGGGCVEKIACVKKHGYAHITDFQTFIEFLHDFYIFYLWTFEKWKKKWATDWLTDELVKTLYPSQLRCLGYKYSISTYTCTFIYWYHSIVFLVKYSTWTSLELLRHSYKYLPVLPGFRLVRYHRCYLFHPE